MNLNQCSAAINNPNFLEFLGAIDTHFTDNANQYSLPARWGQNALGVIPGILTAAEKARRTHIYVNDSDPASFDQAIKTGHLRPYYQAGNPASPIQILYDANDVQSDTAGKNHGLQVVSIIHSISPLAENRCTVNLSRNPAYDRYNFNTGDVENYSNASSLTKHTDHAIVFAAGNSSNTYSRSKHYNSIIVSSLGPAGFPSKFSDRGVINGNYIDFCAPGHNHMPGLIGTSAGISGLAYFGGTSAAAPMVTGVIGQLYKIVPKPDIGELRIAMIVAAFEAPYAVAPPVGANDTYDHWYGYGMVNYIRTAEILRTRRAQITTIKANARQEFHQLIESKLAAAIAPADLGRLHQIFDTFGCGAAETTVLSQSDQDWIDNNQSIADEYFNAWRQAKLIACHDGDIYEWYIRRNMTNVKQLAGLGPPAAPYPYNSFTALVTAATDQNNYFNLVRNLFIHYFNYPSVEKLEMIREFYQRSGFPFYGLFFHTPWYIKAITNDETRIRNYLSQIMAYFRTLALPGNQFNPYGNSTTVHDFSASAACVDTINAILLNLKTTNTARYNHIKNDSSIIAFYNEFSSRLPANASACLYGDMRYLFLSKVFLSHLMQRMTGGNPEVNEQALISCYSDLWGVLKDSGHYLIESFIKHYYNSNTALKAAINSSSTNVHLRILVANL